MARSGYGRSIPETAKTRRIFLAIVYGSAAAIVVGIIGFVTFHDWGIKVAGSGFTALSFAGSFQLRMTNIIDVVENWRPEPGAPPAPPSNLMREYYAFNIPVEEKARLRRFNDDLCRSEAIGKAITISGTLGALLAWWL